MAGTGGSVGGEHRATGRRVVTASGWAWASRAVRADRRPLPGRRAGRAGRQPAGDRVYRSINHRILAAWRVASTNFGGR